MHLVTQQGRDHLVKTHLDNRTLMVANVHLEPGSSLRKIRERLQHNSTHWSAYPECLGVLIGDFNTCEPKEGRFNVTVRTFSDGDPGRSAAFPSIFPHVLEIDNPSFPRKVGAPDGTLRFFSPGLTGPSLTSPSLKLGSSIVTPMRRMSLVFGPHRATTLRSVSEKKTNHNSRACDLEQSWLVKHPVFCSMLK